ncbi:hypothetical protein ABZ832_28600 [Streptantibioticus parmotrematis]|uniref:hypothetical protein n=1 Tax=Streptantibioticus parmotrematis TaxID=2873249 RepID=UPI0033CBADE4
MSAATPPPLDLLLGAQQAATFIRRTADHLADQDLLAPAAALRQACERITDGDPLLLATPGQTWALHDDIDPDDAPAQRLTVHLRLSCPPRIYASDADQPDGEIDELLLEVLDLYQLQSWDPAHLNPAAVK